MGINDLEALGTSLELIQSFLTSLAICIGGIWAYLNFIKGRLYHSKLELSILLELNRLDSELYLLVTSDIKNVGLGRVNVSAESSALIIAAVKQSGSSLKASSTESEEIGFFDVFRRDEFIESGESIREQQVIGLSDYGNVAFRATLRVVGRNHWIGTRQYEWGESATLFTKGPVLISSQPRTKED